MQACKTSKKVVSTPIRIEIETEAIAMDDANIPIYLRSDYLAAFQESLLGKSRLFFSVVYKGSEVIAFGSMQEIKIAAASIHSFGRLFSSDKSIIICIEGMLKSFVSSLNRKAGIKLLVVGNTQVSGPYGMWFKEGLNETEKAHYWEAVLQKIESSDLNVDIILVKDLDASQLLIKNALVSNKYKEISTLPIMKMEIPSNWESAEDYYAAFSSKYRIRANSARKKTIGITRRELDLSDLFKYKEEMQLLYTNVYTRARFRLFQVQNNYFIEMKKCLKDDFKVFGYFYKEEMVSFHTLIFRNNSCEAHLIGLNYDFNKSHALYQNMLYDCVEEAILNKAFCIDFGRTAMEIKSTIGAIPFEADVLLKFTNPLLNNIASFILKKNTTEKWVQRHPFK